jgi:hypothetical protein
MNERHAEPAPVDRTADRAEPGPPPYAPPAVTPLGTLAELTAGDFSGDGGDISSYQS